MGIGKQRPHPVMERDGVREGGVAPSSSPTLKDLARPPRSPHSPLTELGWGAALPRGVETILVVEDGPLCRVLAAEILAELGYQVLEASEAVEALALHRADSHRRIDLLLTDSVMEDMCGEDLADAMCAERAGLKVVLMSGYPLETLRDRGVGKAPRPALPFLSKPFTAVDLARTVRRVLDGKHAA